MRSGNPAGLRASELEQLISGRLFRKCELLSQPVRHDLQVDLEDDRVDKLEHPLNQEHETHAEPVNSVLGL